jgi:4-diphosphocytidyl-2-methyl-D-erithritol synthase
MQRNVIILAGGSGLRMGADRPKQFLLLGGKSIILRTIEAFMALDFSVNIYLVLPPGGEALWDELNPGSALPPSCVPVTGGFTRFHSVKNALDLLPAEGITAVHDGVRPLVDKDLIARCFDLAQTHPAVIPVREVQESLRELTDGGSRAVNRQTYRLMQTPQVFDTGLLKQAYRQGYHIDFTDDATVVEKTGCPLFFTEGSLWNIKITTPEDLALAERLVRN